MSALLWILALAASTAAILCFAAGRKRSRKNHKRLYKIFGLLMCLLVFVALEPLYTVQKTIFIGLGLLCFSGFAIVLLMPLLSGKRASTQNK